MMELLILIVIAYAIIRKIKKACTSALYAEVQAEALTRLV